MALLQCDGRGLEAAYFVHPSQEPAAQGFQPGPDVGGAQQHGDCCASRVARRPVQLLTFYSSVRGGT